VPVHERPEHLGDFGVGRRGHLTTVTCAA
jgi:hypothetical protein